MLWLPRRRFLAHSIATGAALALPGCDRPAPPPTPAPTGFPGKVSDLVLHTDRPPNLETPTKYFVHDLTPNDAFFVRWHLALLPLATDPATWRLRVDGHIDAPQSLSLDDLRRMEPVELVAVNQCSGNSRSLFEPRVPGVQWRNGAVGNARWKGVRLRDVIAASRPKAGAVDVSFHGMDRAPLPSVAEYEKSLPFDVATAGDVLLAYEMNGAPLPLLNGFPLRVVAPGLYSTYWVKALDRLSVHAAPYDGYWVKKAYRVPQGGVSETPDALAKDTVPIGKMKVRSLLVSPEEGAKVQVGKPVELEGIAWDGGTGIARVEVSFDDGATWVDARLDAELGKHSFRRFRATWTPKDAGPRLVMVRATNGAGEKQPDAPGWSRSGYLRNVVERVTVTVSA